MREQTRSPSTDEIFDAFSNAHRRRVLVRLLDHNPQPVEQMTGPSRDTHELDSGVFDAFSADARKSDGADNASLQLYHRHLPKLVDYGFIEWDRDENEVHKGPNFDDIRPLLVLLEENRKVLPNDWR